MWDMQTFCARDPFFSVDRNEDNDLNLEVK